jgi:uncharacterized protein YkwD
VHRTRISEKAVPDQATILYTGCATGTETPAPVDADREREILDRVNIERKQQSLPPLKLDTELSYAARYYAVDMADDDYFEADHDTYDRDGDNNLVKVCTTWERVGAFYSYNSAGENIAAGYGSPEDVMTGWMNSSGHRANILSTDFREMGVGYHWTGSSSYGHYWVQDFGRQSGVYPVLINSDSARTDHPRVRLYIYGSWDEMRIRNDSDNWSEWMSFSNEMEWVLNPMPGTRTVNVEMRTGSTVVTATDEILYDPPTVVLDARLWLSGAYRTAHGVMSDQLRQENRIPLSSPSGLELTAIPEQVVDWITIELRKSLTGSAWAIRDGFIDINGTVRDTDGSVGLGIPAPEGDYYILFQHRNHIPVITSDAHMLAVTAGATVDISDGSGVYGVQPLMQLDSHTFGLYPGDANADDQVTLEDYTTWRGESEAGTTGYTDTDFRLDSNVTGRDYTLWYNSWRVPAETQIP